MSFPEGWIQERFLRSKRYVAQVTSAAEDTNVIPVTVTMGLFEKREIAAALAAGDSPSTVVHARSEYDESIPNLITVELVDLSTGLRPAAAAFTITATAGGAGSIQKGSGTAFVTAEISSDAGLQIDVTDVVGATGLELAVVVHVLNAVGGSAAAIIAFD